MSGSVIVETMFQDIKTSVRSAVEGNGKVIEILKGLGMILEICMVRNLLFWI